MPAADFSSWVAERLADEDWDSILELLSFIASDTQLADLNRTFQRNRFGAFIESEPSTLHELQAIAILTRRTVWKGHEDSENSLLTELFQQCLACRSFAIRDAAVAHLLDGANKLIRRRNRERSDICPAQSMLQPECLFTQNIPEISTVGHGLRRFPVTFRACISYSLDRGSPVSGTVRPQLNGHYGLRQCGLSDRQNADFFSACGIFEPPSDLKIVAGRLSKDELLQIADSHQIEVAKSWKKERFVETLMNNEAARGEIASRAAGNLLQIRCDARTAFDTWMARTLAVRNIASCLSCA
jgi:hypothetical protein